MSKVKKVKMEKHTWIKIGYCITGTPDMFIATVTHCTINEAMRTVLFTKTDFGKEVHNLHVICYA